MITNILACAICTYAPFEAELNSCEYGSEWEIGDFQGAELAYIPKMALDQKERDRIWMQWHLCIKRRDDYMYRADQAAFKITNINVRKMTNNAIQTAICSIASGNPATIAIAGCLGGIAHIGGEAFDSFMRTRDLVDQAHFYSQEADRLQEELWRG